jgi:cytochrome c oxidase cbb3-type subunit 4
MDINVLREVFTVLSFVSFLGIVLYALSPANRRRFEEAARRVVEDEEILSASVSPTLSPPLRPLKPHQDGDPRGEGANAGQVFANEGHR